MIGALSFGFTRMVEHVKRKSRGVGESFGIVSICVLWNV